MSPAFPQLVFCERENNLMPLSVIGAGFGRTGTESLKKALEILGYDPCYHMFEVLPHQDRVDQWIGLTQGADPDWTKMFDGYNASVDWPGAHFWRELAAHYEEAKIILTVRESDKWFESMSSTILPLLRSGEPDSLGNKMFVQQTFEGNVDDRDHVIDCYNRHNACVEASIDPDRLLVYSLGSGWVPLCAFLGVDVPETPYPHGNSSDRFDDNMDKANAPRLKPEGE